MDNKNEPGIIDLTESLADESSVQELGDVPVETTSPTEQIPEESLSDEEDQGGSAPDDSASDEEAQVGQPAEMELKEYLKVDADAPLMARLYEVMCAVAPLGCISFGGTEIHLKIFKKRLVDQREWLDEDAFEEFVAMAKGLPGPTSSQLLLAATSMYAGPWGGLLAMMLFNLPSLVFMVFAGMMIREFVDPAKAPWFLAGLPAGALGLLFKSFHSYAEDLDKIEYTILLIAATIAILTDNEENIDPKSSRWLFPTTLACAGVFTFFDSRRDQPWADYGAPSKGWEVKGTKNLKRLGVSAYVGGVILSIIGILLAIIFSLRYAANNDNSNLDTFETSTRIGFLGFADESIIFPYFQNEIITSFRNKMSLGSYGGLSVDEVDLGWMLQNEFLQGLGLAYLCPGSLYNVGAYFGALHDGFGGACLGFIGLFVPGIALMYSLSPFWDQLRSSSEFRAVFKGVHAASTGFMCSACITLFQSTIVDSTDSIIFVFTTMLNLVFGAPIPVSILAGVAIGALLHPNAIDLGQTPYCVDQAYLPSSSSYLLESLTGRWDYSIGGGKESEEF